MVGVKYFRIGRCLEAKRIILAAYYFVHWLTNKGSSFAMWLLSYIKKGGIFMQKSSVGKVSSGGSKLFTSRKLAIAGMLVALSVAINSLRIGSISFGGFPIIFAGLTMGPVIGFVVGAVADIVGFIVRPSASGGFNPLFILTSALTGFIPGLVILMLKDEYPNYKFWKVFVAIATGQLITTVLMVPLFVTLLRQANMIGTQAFWIAFYGRVAKAFARQVVNVPVYSIIFPNNN